MLIHDKSLGIVNDTAVSTVTDFWTTPASNESISNADTTSVTSFSNTSVYTENSVSAPSTCSTKQIKLAATDKERIKRVYEELDQASMWKLSTGTVVEKKMEEFALSCSYEHPAHSLILDTTDKSWTGYFTKEEMKEITTQNAKTLPELPTKSSSYIDDLEGYRALIR
ncbi:hypothetical protein BDF20DRAFT_840531 [Mycotypha africana]|uniref:uncharacterized protein n=1 Tax=Mycotypha africana TaxID=64632 RepID=UPI002300D8AD|nr:uncharacterized protein BDF20DRAFT_840531 [Mycotypha africana]KAI8966995.1 hypothetical protein BDF20DRAFT_840531 [Mycotypha africana]